MNFINFPPTLTNYFFVILLIIVIGLVISIVFYPLLINFLTKRELGQNIRSDGPQSHLAKAKTPTMGGIIFIFITIYMSIATCKFLQIDLLFLPWMLILGFACGLIGFTDDLAKTLNKTNKGISGYIRLILEGIIGMIASYYTVKTWNHSFDELVKNFTGYIFELKIPGSPLNHFPVISYIYSAFMQAACCNSINIHDGMDGLAAGTSSLSFMTMAFIFLMLGEIELAIICASLTGALLGFLMFNCHKAKIFMGDTGSLFIGGMFGLIIISYQFNLMLIALMIIPALETLSVIFQVLYFKATKELNLNELPANSLYFKLTEPLKKLYLLFYKMIKKIPGEGKRLFKMAPIHHHFEILLAPKFSEWQVVNIFWLCQLIICIGVLIFFNFSIGTIH